MAAEAESKQRQLYCPTEDLSFRHLANPSVDYTDNHVKGDLHPAFQDPETTYSDDSDNFVARPDTITDEKALSDSQQAFSKALQDYEKDADPKYKTGIDLKVVHTWDGVIKEAEIACDKYKGVGKEGIMTSIRCGLRNFHSAAPAIEAWLKLLPSTSIYGSVVCGGLTIILEAAVKLGQLREDTYLVLDQIPHRVEKAGVFMKIYKDAKMRKQAADLYKAILDALQHILAWYKRKACRKFIDSFGQGPAYATTLKAKMKNIENISQAMEDHAGLNQHVRVHHVRRNTSQTKSQLDNIEKTTEELKDLALEARNALYAVFRDTEAWEEVAQFWAALRDTNEKRRTGLASSQSDQQGDVAQRERFLLSFGHDESQLAQDVEDAIRQIFQAPLVEQDRAVAIIQDPMVETWMVGYQFNTLLIHANSRRHDPISPASVACAMLVHTFSTTMLDSKFPCITLFWFCGSHTNGPNDNAAALMRSLICQLLVTNPFDHGFNQIKDFDGQNLGHLLDMFTDLLRQLTSGTAVVCIIDGISFYEDFQLREDTIKTVRRLVKISRVGAPIFKLLLTSPVRTSHVHQEPAIAKHIRVVEIPQHVNGAKQGFNHRAMIMETEQRARRLSTNSGSN